MSGPSTRCVRFVLAVSLLTMALSLTGCVSLPSSGPVVTSTNAGTKDQPAAIDIDPLGPQRGAAPDEIVGGFLDAMLQTPIRTTARSRGNLAKSAAEA